MVLTDFYILFCFVFFFLVERIIYLNYEILIRTADDDNDDGDGDDDDEEHDDTILLEAVAQLLCEYSGHCRRRVYLRVISFLFFIVIIYSFVTL